MIKLQCIILEDEPVAIQKMISYIQKTDFLELKNTFSDPLLALQFLENDFADIAFVDIQMPEISGMDWAKIVKGKLMLIFTTAYSKYAIEGYKVNAIDYLLKPFSYAEFYEAALKAWQMKEKNKLPTTTGKNFLFVKVGYKVQLFNFDEIKYIKASVDYSEIFLNKTSVLANITLNEILNQLPSSIFLRVHRSFIVNISKITFIERNTILIDNERIPVSCKYLDNFKLITGLIN